MLERVTDGVWTAHRPLRFFGVETGTRMTIIHLADGGVIVHSPVALDATTRDAVDAIGTVRAILAPSLFHHLYVGEWASAYPGAALFACPGLEKKRNDVKWSGILGDAPESPWKGELEQVFFGARALENEVIFFHRKSKTIVSSDFIFNFGTHPSRFTRIVGTLLGQRRPGPTFLEHLMIRDRPAAREQMARVVAWGAERIVLAHGDIIHAEGAKVVADAYAWL